MDGGDITGSIILYVLFGVVYIAGVFGWSINYSDNEDRTIARGLLVSPIWPLATLVIGVIAVLKGFFWALRSAELMPSHKPDYNKIESLENSELEFKDRLLEAELAQAELQQKLDQAQEQLRKEQSYNYKHKIKHRTRGDY